MKRPVSPPDRSQEDRNLSKMTTTKPLAGNLGDTQVAILRQNTWSQNCYGPPWSNPGSTLENQSGLGSEPRTKRECKPDRHWESTDPPESPLPLGRAPEDHGTSLWRSSMHSPLASRRTTRPCLKTSKKQIKTPKNRGCQLRPVKTIIGH